MTGVVVWFTGPPSSGKSTLALRVAAELDRPVLLDGDEVREALRPPLGFTEEERDAFYETLARLAALLAQQGFVVLVAATAHRRFFRQRARAFAPKFVEVFVDTPLEECVRRDAKGLYARSTPELPGGDVSYERPVAPEVVVAPEDELAAVLTAIGLAGPSHLVSSNSRG